MRAHAPLCILTFSLFVTPGAFAAAEKSAYAPLTGKWSGQVAKNLRDKALGGTPSEGEVGTPVVVQLAETKTGLEGTSRLGRSTETWRFEGADYVWFDDAIEVRATLVDAAALPEWMKKELALTAKGKSYVFRFASCVVRTDRTPCAAPQHYPAGMEKTGHWVFAVDANQLRSFVLYEYPGGQRRVLAESLKKE